MQSATTNDSGFPEISVNGVAISENDIGAELQYHQANDVGDALNEAAKALIVRQLMLQRAAALELISQVTPGGLQVPLSDLKESQQEQAIADLLDKELDLPEADEETCRHYYDANREKFQSPPLVEASHVLFAGDPKDIAKRRQQKAKAEAVLEQLQSAPYEFGHLAREHSDCPSRETDGNLGQITKGSTVAEFEKQVFSLPQGLAKYPIETRYGYHVVHVNHRIEGQQLPFEAVTSKIAEYLNNQVYLRAISQYISYLASEADIKGFDFEGADSPLVQ